MCMNQECFRSLEVINLRSHTERLETDIRLASRRQTETLNTTPDATAITYQVVKEAH